jgi:hypothetical protein
MSRSNVVPSVSTKPASVTIHELVNALGLAGRQLILHPFVAPKWQFKDSLCSSIETENFGSTVKREKQPANPPDIPKYPAMHRWGGSSVETPDVTVSVSVQEKWENITGGGSRVSAEAASSCRLIHAQRRQQGNRENVHQQVIAASLRSRITQLTETRP